MTDTTLVPIKGTFLRVQAQHLHDSPTQPRDSYDEAYLDELAESIKANGDILSDLLIRKRMSNPLRPLDTWTLEDDGYETIYGHCRKRAGVLVGLADLPCKLVEMSDEQVQKAQLAENLNRKGLTFIEEAETLSKLRRNFKVGVPELMKISGKSQTYVYNQLKLAEACQAVKDACKSGKLNQELATLVARIPAHKLQESALKTALEHFRMNDGVGYRKTKRDLLDKYSLFLKDAFWSLDDAELVPSAGACNTCPSRSGATPALYSDVVFDKPAHYYDSRKHGKDVCMNPECFALKKKTYLELDARELAAGGKVVVTGNAAKQALTAAGDVKGTTYVAVKDVKQLLKGVKGEARPQTVLIQNQTTGKTVEAIKRSDLAGSGVQAPAAKNGHEQNRARQQDDQKKWEAKAQAERAYRSALFATVRESVGAKPRSMFELREVARLLVTQLHGSAETLVAMANGGKTQSDLVALLPFLTADQLGALMVECVMAKKVGCDWWDMQHQGVQGSAKALRAMAQHHGIDVKAHRAAYDAAKGLSTPSPAAQSQGKEAAKKPNKAAAGAKAEAIPAAPGGGPCGRNPDDDRTLELPLEEAQSQPAPPESDKFHTPAQARQTLSPQAAWPFKDRQPSAANQSNDAGVAGDTSAAAGRKHDEETEA